MSDSQDDFAQARAALEEADARLAEALEARAKACVQIADVRKRDPDGYYALPRETDVVGKARDRVPSLRAPSLSAIYREILSACASIVAPVRIAYAGPEGNHAGLAARRQFGASAQTVAVDGVAQVIDDVAHRRAEWGIVPLEVFPDGALTPSFDLLVRSDAKICAELNVVASWDLVSRTGNATDVEKVYGAAAALLQCERALRASFPRASLIEVPSGVVASQFVAEDHGAAALVTESVSELAGLRTVRAQVDGGGAEIRFAVIGLDQPPRTGTDRTLIAFGLHDAPGALFKALEPFAQRSVNLARLESRPLRGEGRRPVFYAEIDGHVTDRPMLTAVEELRASTRFTTVLGSYPRPA